MKPSKRSEIVSLLAADLRSRTTRLLIRSVVRGYIGPILDTYSDDEALDILKEAIIECQKKN